MRTVLLLGLCLLSGFIGTAQTVLLPTWVADSLIYEAKLSRQCSQVLTAQQEEIKALGAENVHLGTALKLSQSESSTLSSLLTNSKESINILTQQFALDKKKLKAKIKRLWVWVTSEGVVIVVLIVLL